MTGLLEELFDFMYSILLEVFSYFTMDLIDGCSPNLDFLHSQVPMLQKTDVFFMSVAAALAVLALAISLLINMMKEKPSVPANLIFGFIGAVFWIGLGKKIIDIVLAVSDDVFVQFKRLLSNNTHSYIDNMVAGNSILDTIWLIIILIFLLEGFFELAKETIERYAILGVFYHMSPLMAFTLISEDDRKNFVSFVKIYLSQIFLLFMNVFFMQSAITILADMQVNSIKECLFPAILCYAWLKIGTEMDKHLNSVGISTAQAGRLMFDNIVNPVKAISTTVKGISDGTYKATTGAAKKGVETAANMLGVVGGGVASAATQMHDKHKLSDTTAHNILKGKKDETLTGPKAASGIASFFPSMNGKNVTDGQISKNGAVATVSNADGTTTDVKLSKTKTAGSIPITDFKGNRWYVTAVGNGPMYGYGAATGDSATLASRFSDNDISNLGFSGSDKLTNNGDGSLSITDQNGNTVGAMFNPKEYNGSLEGANYSTDSDGNTWATFKTGSADHDLSSRGVMDCIDNSYGEGQVNPITDVDTSDYATTGSILATRQDGSTETIDSNNAPQYFGGSSLSSVADYARDNSAYTEATGKNPTNWDSTNYASAGYYTVNNSDGSTLRVYSSAIWQPTHGANHFTANDGSQYFTEEGTMKLHKNQDGTRSQQVVYKAKPRRKKKR